MLSKSTLTGIFVDFIILFFVGGFFLTAQRLIFSQYYINIHFITTEEMNYIALGVLIKDYMHSMITGSGQKFNIA